jgi:hypothetical protein
MSTTVPSNPSRLERDIGEVRETHWEFPIDNLVRDFRYALRNLSRDRRFAFLGILTLALGIGAATSIFSIVWAEMNGARFLARMSKSRCNASFLPLDALFGVKPRKPVPHEFVLDAISTLSPSR